MGTWKDLVKGDQVISDQGQPWHVVVGLCEDSPRRVTLSRDGETFSFTPRPALPATYLRGEAGTVMDLLNRCGLNVSVIR